MWGVVFWCQWFLLDSLYSLCLATDWLDHCNSNIHASPSSQSFRFSESKQWSLPVRYGRKNRHPVIVECFDQFSQQINKRTYVLLDNSPLHRSQAFIRHIPQWVKRGLIIKYLPPYSPELNLIEILWRFIKYHWLPFSAYMSFPCLAQAIEDILTHFGTDYTINFQATWV